MNSPSLVNLILGLYNYPVKKQVQHPLKHVSKETLKLPALLRIIPKFPLFPATVDDKALENSSHEPEAQSSLTLSLIREPFLKLKYTNTMYAFYKTFGCRLLKQFAGLLNIGVYCIS